MLAGYSAEARQWLEMPIEGGEGEGFRVQRWRQHLHLAEWERRYGDAAKAREHVAAAEASVGNVGGRESARYAQLLRTRALLAQAEGEHQLARADFEQALTILRATRGDRYVGVGELLLDLVERNLEEMKRSSARNRLLEAEPILDPVLSTTAPQRARYMTLTDALSK